MSAHAFGLIELLGVFGVVLGWAVWQLISVRREIKRSREKKDGSR